MEKQICINGHEKIREAYDNLIKNGKKGFDNNITLLKNPLGKMYVSSVIHQDWKNYKKLVNILKNLTKNLKKYKMTNDMHNFVIYLESGLKKVKKPDDLVILFYKILDRKDLYTMEKKMLKILKDKDKCMEYFKK